MALSSVVYSVVLCSKLALAGRPCTYPLNSPSLHLFRFHYSALAYIPVFIIFFIKASDKPENTSHMLNAIRPFRFSNKINKEELFKLVNDRECQNEKPFAPWMKIMLNKDVWLYCLAWFCACFNLSFFTIFPQRYYQLFLGASIGKITKVFGIQGRVENYITYVT